MDELFENLPIIENIDKAREEFAKALYRQSYMMWDNLGLHVSTKDLPTQPIYKLCAELMNGSGNYFKLRGRLSRFWCTKLRPVLMPERQALIEIAYKEICILQKQALLNCILEQAEERGLYNYE